MIRSPAIDATAVRHAPIAADGPRDARSRPVLEQPSKAAVEVERAARATQHRPAHSKPTADKDAPGSKAQAAEEERAARSALPLIGRPNETPAELEPFGSRALEAHEQRGSLHVVA